MGQWRASHPKCVVVILGILNNMKVPFPPVDERRAIITFLNAATSELGDGIETTMRQINTLSEYRTRLISDVVTGQLDLRDAVVELPSPHL